MYILNHTFCLFFNSRCFKLLFVTILIIKFSPREKITRTLLPVDINATAITAISNKSRAIGAPPPGLGGPNGPSKVGPPKNIRLHFSKCTNRNVQERAEKELLTIDVKHRVRTKIQKPVVQTTFREAMEPNG